MRELRRRMHARPEIGLDLPRTQQMIVDELEALEITVTRGTGLSSVIGVIEGEAPGPTVLLRADMDALPISEETDLEYRSEVNGVMHACGHDMHAAMLLGAARVLRGLRESIAGSVMLVFQPGEEGHGGATLMLEEGMLDVGRERPVAAYALHVMASPWRHGMFTIGSGPVLAAADRVDIVMRGAGGHAATPHLAGGALGAAAAAALELPSAVARCHDPLQAAVCNVGILRAGTAPNVIAAEALVTVTLRTFDPDVRARSLAVIERVSNGAALMHNATVAVTVTPRYAVTVNNPASAEGCVTALAELFPGRIERMTDPSFGSEDFGSVLDVIPGAMVFLGAAAPGSEAANHAPDVRFDEALLPDGTAALVSLAMQHVAR
jgi:hippurate hydrolase